METKAQKKFLENKSFSEVATNARVLLADEEKKLVLGTDINARVLITKENDTVYVAIAKSRSTSEMDDFTPAKLNTNVKCKLNLKTGKFSLTFNETAAKVQAVGVNGLRSDMLAVADAIWQCANKPQGSC